MKRPDNYQELLAKCYVAVSEIDHDLMAWQRELWPLQLVNPLSVVKPAKEYASAGH